MPVAIKIILRILGALVLLAVLGLVVLIWQLDKSSEEHFAALGLRSYLPSDGEMIAYFHAHRDGFEALVAAMQLLPEMTTIAVDFERGNPSAESVATIRPLLREAQVYSADKGGPGTVTIAYAAYGMLDEGWYKEYRWGPNPRADELTDDLDQAASDIGHRNGQAYRHIEGDWYLYYLACY